MIHTLLNSTREILAQLLRSTLAKRRHPHVFFGHNVAVGDNCTFGSKVRVYAGASLANVVIGDFSYVGGGCVLQYATVGRFCSIGPSVRVGLGLHPIDYVSTYPGFYSSDASGSVPFVNRSSAKEHDPIVIGHDVWIGANALILDGVQVGHGAVIAAGAVVTKNVAPYSVVGGVPAREIRKRFEKTTVEALLKFAWWDKEETFLRANAERFVSPATLMRGSE